MQRFMASANLLHGFYEHLFFDSSMLALVEILDSTRSEEPDSNLMLRYASIISSCIHICSSRLRLRNQQKAEGPNCCLAVETLRHSVGGFVLPFRLFNLRKTNPGGL